VLKFVRLGLGVNLIRRMEIVLVFQIALRLSFMIILRVDLYALKYVQFQIISETL